MTRWRKFKIRRYKVTRNHKGEETHKFMDYVRSSWDNNMSPDFTDNEKIAYPFTEMACAKMVAVLTTWADIVVEKPYEFKVVECTKEFYDNIEGIK